MVVDGGVDVVEAQAALVGGAFGPAVGASAAAVGDASELLDVHVDQGAGTVPLIAVGRLARRPDDLPGQRVALGQPGSPARRRIWVTVRSGTPVASAMNPGPARNS